MSSARKGHLPPAGRTSIGRSELPETTRAKAREKLLGWMDAPDIACILGLIDEKGQPT